MLVILTENVANLGSVGDTIKVRDGYGRNFLVPNGMAVIADTSNVKRLEHQKRQAASSAAKLKGVSEALAAKIADTPITLRMTVGEEGKLFGSITNRDIAEAYAAEGIELDKRMLVLSEPIKSVGAFNVAVKLGFEVEATAKVFVVEE